ncbi:hypothetical protein KI387_029834, partial [Taxus chinensis]
IDEDNYALVSDSDSLSSDISYASLEEAQCNFIQQASEDSDSTDDSGYSSIPSFS